MTTPAVAPRTRQYGGLTVPTPGTFSIDPAHSEVGFVVRHMMVSKVRGRFSDVTGAIEVAEEPSASTVAVTIQANSINTKDEARDNHIRTADFLDVANHPTIEFRSSAIELDTSGEVRLTGDLTIRGVTRPVTLTGTYEGVVDDPYGGQRIGFSVAGEIVREDFGVSFGAMLETGGAVVARNVRLEIEVEAVRQA
jgi:polyisoprenoid-binding protein YceI